MDKHFRVLGLELAPHQAKVIASCETIWGSNLEPFNTVAKTCALYDQHEEEIIDFLDQHGGESSTPALALVFEVTKPRTINELKMEMVNIYVAAKAEEFLQ